MPSDNDNKVAILKVLYRAFEEGKGGIVTTADLEQPLPSGTGLNANELRYLLQQLQTSGDITVKWGTPVSLVYISADGIDHLAKAGIQTILASPVRFAALEALEHAAKAGEYLTDHKALSTALGLDQALVDLNVRWLKSAGYVETLGGGGGRHYQSVRILPEGAAYLADWKARGRNVFVSHITLEREVAFKLQREIASAFGGQVEVFVSSNTEDLVPGSEWLRTILDALRSTSYLVTLCSPESVKRPWINWEAGVAWGRNVPVTPVVHSGLKLGELPLPLSIHQGLSLVGPDLVKLVGAIAKKLEVRPVEGWTPTEFA